MNCYVCPRSLSSTCKRIFLKEPQFENVLDQHGVLSTFMSTAKKENVSKMNLIQYSLLSSSPFDVFFYFIWRKNVPEIFCISDVRASKTEW